MDLRRAEALPYSEIAIFIVDDNPANTLMLKQVVEAENFKAVHVFNDPEQALSAFHQVKPQLILLDLLMPKISGIEFLQLIAAEVATAEVAVIILTASHDSEQRMQALSLGAQDYIEKPFNIIETLQRIKNVLNLHHRKEAFQRLSEDLGGRLKKTKKDLSDVIVTLNSIFENSSEFVFVTNEQGIVTDCNKVAKERFGIATNSYCNLFERFNMNVQLLDVKSPELTVTDVHNKKVIVELNCSKVEINHFSHFVFVLNDITSRKEDEITLKYLAETHYITHLPNRSQVETLVNNKYNTLSSHEHLSYIFISFTDNSKITEVYGHERLEYLLLSIALILVELTSRYESVLIHWGDNDFLVAEEATKAEQIVNEITKRFDNPIQVGETEGWGVHSKPIIGQHVGPSVAGFNAKEIDFQVQCALQATFEGARTGRRLVRYDTAMHDKIQYQAMIEAELLKAIANDGFRIAYQPKIEFATGKVISAEALIRWNHADFGMIRPDIFIPIAESCGLIKEIGALVLNKVFHDIPRIRQKYLDIKYVAVNVAAPQLDKSFIELLKQLSIDSGHDNFNFIELEITETSFLDDFERVGPILQQIKALGLRLALDDFGTGYSSLSYLHLLPVDTLKIDRAFVMPIHSSYKSMLMAKSIISMSLALGLDIVAEGIEDKETAEWLSSMGVQMGQGFYYYKPAFLDDE